MTFTFTFRALASDIASVVEASVPLVTKSVSDGISRGEYIAVTPVSGKDYAETEVVSDYGCVRTTLPITDHTGDEETLYISPTKFLQLVKATRGETVEVEVDTAASKQLKVSPVEDGKKKRRRAVSSDIDSPSLIAESDNFEYQSGDGPYYSCSGADFSDNLNLVAKALTSDTKSVVKGIHFLFSRGDRVLRVTATNGTTRIIQSGLSLRESAEDDYSFRLEEKTAKELSKIFARYEELVIGRGEGYDVHIRCFLKTAADAGDTLGVPDAEYFIETVIEAEGTQSYPESSISKRMDQLFTLDSVKVDFDHSDFGRLIASANEVGSISQEWQLTRYIVLSSDSKENILTCAIDSSVTFSNEMSATTAEDFSVTAKANDIKDVIVASPIHGSFQIAYMQDKPKAILIRDGLFKASISVMAAS